MNKISSDAKALGLALMIAMVIIAVLVVPAGTFSVSVTPKGSAREDTPKAVAAPEVQSRPEE